MAGVERQSPVSRRVALAVLAIAMTTAPLI
jgi:hypothetical protein